MEKFPKKYNTETDRNSINEREKLFSLKKKNTKKPQIQFATCMLPMSDKLHLGHIYGVLLQDIFARTLRLRGEAADWTVGMAHHSFFTLADTSKKVFDNSATKFLIRQMDYNKKQIKALGLTCDYSTFAFTLAETFTNFARKIFVDLYKQKKIYEDKNIVYRDPKNKNILSKTEILYKKKSGKLYNIRYFVDMKRDSIVVGTFSPENIFADVALAVNPADKRYRKLVGKNAIIPIINKAIPIIADEEVRVQDNNGVVRVTPCHDEFSLKIAQKHKLPLDQYATDFDGCFTANAGIFAGKKVEEFAKNITQFLDDISNIDSVVDAKYEVPTCKKTGQELELLLTDQRFLKFNSDKVFDLIENVQSGRIQMFPDTYLDEIVGFMKENMNRCISKQNCFGQRMPIWKDGSGASFIADDDLILEKYTADKNKKTKKYLLSLIIFNLIADSLLPEEFDGEMLLDTLFSQSLDHTSRTRFETYLAFLADKYPTQKDLLKEIEDARELLGVDSIQKVEKILQILDKSFVIKSLGDAKYAFDFGALFGSKEYPKQVEYIFDYGFSRVLGTIQYLLGAQDVQSEKYLLTGYNNISSWLSKTLMFACDYLGQQFSKIYLNNILLDKNGKKLSFISDNVDSAKLIKEHGADALRLALMLDKGDEKKDFHFEEAIIIEYVSFVEKFWNASRFVYSRVDESLRASKNISLENVESLINSNIEKLTDFDCWILYTLRSLVEEANYSWNNNTVLPYGKKVVEFIKKDFCDLYMEISKIQSGDITHLVLLYVNIVLVKLLSPYAPFFAEKFWEHMNIKEAIAEKLNVNIVDTMSKSYRINLFFDIVSKIFQLKHQVEFKKHDLVEICIQASSDFLANIKKYEAILFKIAKISSIEYLGSNQDIPAHYTIGSVIDINIGVKRMEMKSKKENLHELLKQFDSQKEYLQYLRNLIGKSSDAEFIAEKTKEMKKLKDNIENIEYEINKTKIGS